jgi:hypothetical protein
MGAFYAELRGLFTIPGLTEGKVAFTTVDANLRRVQQSGD